jgi:hypothetical protein
MRATGAGLCAVLLVAGCGGPAKFREREFRRMPAALVSAPKGVKAVNGGPVCVEYERTGGTYGKPRYVVWLSLVGDHKTLLAVPRNDTRRVFYDVQVEAGGRVYDLAFPLGNFDFVGKAYLPVLKPAPLTSSGSLYLQPANRIGDQEIPRDMKACRLTIAEPTKAEVAAGGRVMDPGNGETVVLDPDGNERSMNDR